MTHLFRWLVAKKLDYQSGLYELLPHIIREAAISVAVVAGAFFLGGPVFGLVSLALPAYVCVVFVMNYYEHERVSPRKGHRLQRDDKVRLKANKLRQGHFAGDRGVLWGKVRVPTRDVEKNFLIVGNIGSGKTLTVRLLMKDQLPLIQSGSDKRALIYDSKQDTVQTLAGMGLDCPMSIFNPFDERGVAWALAKDIDSIPIANTFAEYLIPSSPHASQRYFEEAPQALLAAVLHVFLKRCPGEWTFRQLVLVMQSIERIEQITAKDTDAQETVRAIVSQIGSRGRGNLLSSIVSKTRQYKAIAACWENAKKSISVKQWLAESSILVLGNYEPARTEINRLASMFMDRLSKEMLSLPDNTAKRTWLYFDELTEAGELHGLSNLILRGRSKGSVAVLGFQDIGSLYKAYGREAGEGFISQCGNRAYLHLKSHQTAQWASDSLGKREAYLPDAAGHLDSQSVVPPEHFYRLPEANLHSTGLHGVYVNGSLGCWTAQYTPTELRALLPAENKSVEGFKLVPSSYCELKPWSAEDSRQFGIPHRTPPSDGGSQDEREGDDPLGGLGRVTPH